MIWLIGSTTTTPIVEEVSACMRAQGKLLAFKLPAPERDDETESLIKRVSDYTTWKNVENVEDLPAHIKSALTDEMLRRYRDPAPVNHDLFLKQKHRESIADTKRLWTTLGVPEDIAGELADDHSVGHKLTLPTTGMADSKCTARVGEDTGSTAAIPTSSRQPAARPFPAPTRLPECSKHQWRPEGSDRGIYPGTGDHLHPESPGRHRRS